MRPTNRLIPLLALFLCAVIAGCGSDDDGDSGGGSAQAKTTATSDRDIVNKTAKSTVSVAGAEGDFHSHGSGIIVDATKGLVLTNAHLIDTARTISIGIGDKKAKGRVVARAQCEDVALLSIYPEQTGLSALTYGDSSTLAAGDKVITLGFPGAPGTGGVGEKIVTTQGAVSATGTTTQLSPLLPDFQDLITHQAPVPKNSTGGPLIDSNGNFVGMSVKVEGPQATEGLPGLYYAISSNRIKSLVGELKPGAQSLYQGWEKYHRCHSDMIKLARSVQVENHDLPKGYKATRGKSADSAEHNTH